MHAARHTYRGVYTMFWTLTYYLILSYAYEAPNFRKQLSYTHKVGKIIHYTSYIIHQKLHHKS